MSSEIKVDTISENTSANGVSIDGVTLKDNGITTTEINNSGGNLTVDVSGNIVLDADTQGSSDGILLKDAGTHYGSIFRSGSDLRLKSQASDEDIVFMGNDGGSEITAWTMDMSDGGHLIPGNAATGIYLGVNSATASNLLNDYEEGTWTPSGSNLGVATNHKAIYRKIGDIVFLYCDITMDSSPADTAQATSLAGFPFTCNDDYFQCNSRVAGLNQTIEANIAGTGAVFRDKADGVVCTRSEFAGERCQHIFIYTIA